MKTRYFLLLAVMFLCSFGVAVAQGTVEEKTPVTINGVWQMCFYRSASPDLPGELKTSNSLKILSDDGHFYNLVMMPQGCILIGYGDYQVKSGDVYTEICTKNIHLPQLDGAENDMYFDLREDGKLMYVRYHLTKDDGGNAINTWCYEIWKRVEMPTIYPDDLVR